MKTNGAEALLLSLMEEGVDTIFGYPGGAIMHIYDALYKHSGRVRHILTRHEQGAVHAAQGYARTTGRVGICFATSGPGATNIITGLADAMLDSTPLVCVTAQVAAAALGSDAFQEADIVSMTIPVTKWNYQVTSAEEVPEAIAKAFHIARTGRPGPVLIDITKNAQMEMIDFRYEPCIALRSYNYRYQVGEGVIDEAVELLNGASRPFILFGQGIKLSGAERSLVEFAEKGNIPMASTLMGLSAVPTSHPLYVGMAGMHGNVAPNALANECDVLIAVGMRFSDRITGDAKQYAPNARVIHIDIDPVEINKVVKAHIGITGDAKEVLDILKNRVKHTSRQQWLDFAWSKQDQEYQSVIRKDLFPAKEALTMGEVVNKVAELTDQNAIIVTDVGQQQMIAARYSKYRNTRSMVTSGGLGTMGYGLPAAIGAKVGCPDRQVVLFVGDGGFQMTMQELGTMMHWGIGVKVVVLNNSYLGMVRQWQQLFFDRRYSATPMVNPDFPKVAQAYNIASARVEKRDELEGALARMLADDSAYLLEVVVDKEDNVFPMIPAGKTYNDLLLNE